MTTTAARLDHLEAHARGVEERLRGLELAAGRAHAVVAAGAREPAAAIPWAAIPTLAAEPAPPRPRAAMSEGGPDATTARGPSSRWVSAVEAEIRPLDAAAPSLEELLGGRVLAWIGGAAVVVGLALLFALGISDGWVGEAARCELGAAGCLALLAGGVRLHERKGRTEAARAAVATGLAGLFLSVTVASSQYALLPGPAGVALAAGVGALAMLLAVRWSSPVIAALGLVGALLAPVLAGVGGSTGSLWFLAVATAAAVAVLVDRRWVWLSACVALVVTPQWIAWLVPGHAAGAEVLVLAAFGALQAVAAVGTALRAPLQDVRALPAVLLAVNALVLATAGWFALGTGTPGIAWLAGLAAAHVALGAGVRRTARLSTDLGLLCLTLGVVLVDVAFALATSGVARGVGWAVGAVAFAALSRFAHERTVKAAALIRLVELGEGATAPPRTGAWNVGARGARAAQAGLGGARAAQAGLAAAAQTRARDAAAASSGLALHVALAVVATLPTVDRATLLAGGVPAAAATTLLAVLAGACLVSARLAPAHRLALDVAGLLAVALLAALSLDGAALTIAWALEGAALCSLGARGEQTAWNAGLLHLGAAAFWCLVDQATPGGLYDGVANLGPAALGLSAVIAATARIALLVDEEDRPLLLAALAVGTLYLASLAVVDLGGTDLRAAQLRLSGLWALVGVAALVLGLRRDVAAVRIGALALLGVTIGKVFVYDLATQEASYRVASFLGLGVLLLGAAFAYQRLRPEAPRDLREVPAALR